VSERAVLGHTSDDACGEAFDKVGKMLGLPYPGGPQIERLAAKSQTGLSRFKFRSTLVDRENRYGFSFSGLKTQVLDAVRRELKHPTGKINGSTLDEATKADIADAFQHAAIGQLIDRIKNALSDHQGIRSIVVAGGVAANQSFRERIFEIPNLEIRFAPMSLCSDNATMIALHAFLPSTQLASPHPFSRYTYTN
jgi:N6-L-threonylcarbamoyladenine synthase